MLFVFVTESDIDVNVQDEGQTGIKDVTGPIPAEEKIYAVRINDFNQRSELL